MVHTVFRVHYRLEFGDFISIRGSSHGLSWDYGHEAHWGHTESGEDVWELAIESDGESNGEFIHFKPLVNDEMWSKGTDYIVRPGDIIDIYPFFFTNNGNVFKSTFQSKILDNKRKLAIYLPPSYHENPYKRYPVILYQDGHNLFFPEDSFCGDTWQLADAMDDLCCNGGIQETIIVGVYPVKREFEYLPTDAPAGIAGKARGGGADKYLDALMYELRPIIDANLRTTNSYGIAGSSYGGIISLYAWVTRPEFFEICGTFSPSLRYDNSVVMGIVKNQLKPRPGNHRLYMDCGTVRDAGETVIELADYLLRDPRLNEEQFLFVIGEGHQHTERHWALRAPRALMYMLADPHRAQLPFIASGQESEQDGEHEGHDCDAEG
eukprot:Phypoly_transcript_07971.p1 GENE.Phypoly_transcript_07971~~Phypoly_transcript_07971.p1  ORF type:complete len:379 (-),score=50.93 Phypoly_transcript_07971:219-1355(-)